MQLSDREFSAAGKQSLKVMAKAFNAGFSEAVPLLFIDMAAPRRQGPRPSGFLAV